MTPTSKEPLMALSLENEEQGSIDLQTNVEPQCADAGPNSPRSPPVDLCGNCSEALDDGAPHLTECWETIGEFYCAECWEEMCEANAAYDREDAE